MGIKKKQNSLICHKVHVLADVLKVALASQTLNLVPHTRQYFSILLMILAFQSIICSLCGKASVQNTLER